MFKEYFEKYVKVTLKNGEVFYGYFSDAFSEYDNDGPATIFVGKWELEEQEIEKMEIINPDEIKD